MYQDPFICVTHLSVGIETLVGSVGIESIAIESLVMFNCALMQSHYHFLYLD